MKNFEIIAVPGNDEDKILPSLHVRNNGKDFAIIWNDKTITFACNVDYFYEDVQYILLICSMFYTFYNNIKPNEKYIKHY